MESEQNSNQQNTEKQSREDSKSKRTHWIIIGSIIISIFVIGGAGAYSLFLIEDNSQQYSSKSQELESSSDKNNTKQRHKDTRDTTSNTQEERDSLEKDTSDQKEESTQDSDSEASTKATIYVKEGDSWIPAEDADDETSGDDNQTNGVSPKKAGIEGYIVLLDGKFIRYTGPRGKEETSGLDTLTIAGKESNPFFLRRTTFM